MAANKLDLTLLLFCIVTSCGTCCTLTRDKLHYIVHYLYLSILSPFISNVFQINV